MRTGRSSFIGSGVGSALAQGFALVLGGGTLMGFQLGFDGAMVLRASTVFGAIMALVIRAWPTHHPFQRFGAANQVTAFRAALVSLLAGFIGEPYTQATAWTILALAALATTLDGVDGWLARRSGLSSALGARFDMETDALLILVLTVLVWRFERAGAWVLGSGALRYVFVASGWALPWMRRPLPPSRRRQSACVLQIVGLIVALLPMMVPPNASWIAAASLAVLSYSFMVDTVWLWRRGPAAAGRHTFASSTHGP